MSRCRESIGLIIQGEMEIFVIAGRSPLKQRNAANLAAKGECIVFIDDDVRGRSDCIQRMINEYSTDDIAAVGGPISPIMKRIRSSGTASGCALGDPGVPSRRRRGMALDWLRSVAAQVPGVAALERADRALLVDQLVRRSMAQQHAAAPTPMRTRRSRSAIVGWALASTPAMVCWNASALPRSSSSGRAEGVRSNRLGMRDSAIVGVCGGEGSSARRDVELADLPRRRVGRPASEPSGASMSTYRTPTFLCQTSRIADRVAGGRLLLKAIRCAIARMYLPVSCCTAVRRCVPEGAPSRAFRRTRPDVIEERQAQARAASVAAGHLVFAGEHAERQLAVARQVGTSELSAVVHGAAQGMGGWRKAMSLSHSRSRDIAPTQLREDH